MISVVICSVKPVLAAQVKRNIEETIGVPWELILIDNRELRYGISKIYNMGAIQARYDHLCFVHEDVLFRTNEWGKLILGYFNTDHSLGLVGIAGAKYKSRTLSGWSCGLSKYDCCNILHINPQKQEHRLFSNPHPGTVLQNVVSADGVFMCTTKDVWQSCKFNEELLTGFHVYDIHFSVTISKKYTVKVTYEIDLIHLTEGGSFGNDWVENTILWHQQFRTWLPAFTSDVATSESLEVQLKKKWLHRLKNEKIKFRNRLRWISIAGVYRHVFLYPHVLLFLLYRPMKKLFT